MSYRSWRSSSSPFWPSRIGSTVASLTRSRRRRPASDAAVERADGVDFAPNPTLLPARPALQRHRGRRPDRRSDPGVPAIRLAALHPVDDVRGRRDRCRPRLRGTVRLGAASCGSVAEIAREHLSRRAWIALTIFIWIALVYVIVAFTDITASTFVGHRRAARHAVQPRRCGGGGERFIPDAERGDGMRAAALEPFPRAHDRDLRRRLWRGVLGTPGLDLARLDVAHPARLWGFIILAYCFIASSCRGGRSCNARLPGRVHPLPGARDRARRRLLGRFPGFSKRPSRVDSGRSRRRRHPLWPFLSSPSPAALAPASRARLLGHDIETDPARIGLPSGGLRRHAPRILRRAHRSVDDHDRGAVAGHGIAGRIYGNGIGQYLTSSSARSACLLHDFGAMAFRPSCSNPRRQHAPRALSRQELCRGHGRLWAAAATLATLAPPLVFLGTAAAPKPGGARVHGLLDALRHQQSALAALSLLGITVWLYRTRRPVWYTLAPTLFVLGVTVWSLLLQARGSLRTV